MSMWNCVSSSIGVAHRRAEQRVERRRWSWSGRCSSRNIAWSSRNEPSGLRSIRLSRMSLRVLRLAVGREPHDLVLAGVDLEADVIGEGRVEQAERVRESGSPSASSSSLPRPIASRRRRPLADAVHGQHRRLLERARDRRPRPRGSGDARQNSSRFSPVEVAERASSSLRQHASSGTASRAARPASPCGRMRKPRGAKAR